jgi:hypothetical protein
MLDRLAAGPFGSLTWMTRTASFGVPTDHEIRHAIDSEDFSNTQTYYHFGRRIPKLRGL